MAKRKPLTPQQRWSRKMKRLGRCARCGSKRNRYRQLCDFHQGQFTLYMKARRSHAKEIANAVAITNTAAIAASANLG